MTDSESHRIKLKVEGITIEVEGPKDYVTEKFDELYEEHILGEVEPPTLQEHPADDQLSRKEKLPSLAEIYQECSVPYKRDSILLIGWVLEKMEGYEDFNRVDLEEKATSAKIELGKNIPRDLKTLVEKAYLKEVGERDGYLTYYLTRTGENYVEDEMGLPDELVERFGGLGDNH